MISTQSQKRELIQLEELNQFSDRQWLEYFYTEISALHKMLRQGADAEIYTRLQTRYNAIYEVISFIKN